MYIYIYIYYCYIHILADVIVYIIKVARGPKRVNKHSMASYFTCLLYDEYKQNNIWTNNTVESLISIILTISTEYFSKLLDNLEEMFLQYYIDSDVKPSM